MKWLLMILSLLFVVFLVFKVLLPIIVFPSRFLPPTPLNAELELLDGLSVFKAGWEGYTTDQPIIVVSHGNGHTLDTAYTQRIKELSKNTGMPVVAWDYPGYGQSAGQSSERSIDLALERLIATLGHPSENIIVIGQSVGTGPTVEWAHRHHCRGVVLITPFTSILKTCIPVSIPFLDIWKSDQKISDITSPVLILGARHDEVIPYDHSRTLASLAQDAELISIKSGHNGIDWIPKVAKWSLKFNSKRVETSNDCSVLGKSNCAGNNS